MLDDTLHLVLQYRAQYCVIQYTVCWFFYTFNFSFQVTKIQLRLQNNQYWAYGKPVFDFWKVDRVTQNLYLMGMIHMALLKRLRKDNDSNDNRCHISVYYNLSFAHSVIIQVCKQTFLCVYQISGKIVQIRLIKSNKKILYIMTNLGMLPPTILQQRVNVFVNTLTVYKTMCHYTWIFG